MTTKRQIFCSFHFDNDVFRVQQIRNIGALEDNEPVSANVWEEVKKRGDEAIKKWINDNMNYRSCVVVLVGEETAKRKWVNYEINKAWKDGKGLLGIYIHNLRDPRTANISPFYGKCHKGINPFELITIENGILLSSKVKCYDPNPFDAYKDIANNLENWVTEAIEKRK